MCSSRLRLPHLFDSQPCRCPLRRLSKALPRCRILLAGDMIGGEACSDERCRSCIVPTDNSVSDARTRKAIEDQRVPHAQTPSFPVDLLFDIGLTIGPWANISLYSERGFGRSNFTSQVELLLQLRTFPLEECCNEQKYRQPPPRPENDAG